MLRLPAVLDELGQAWLGLGLGLELIKVVRVRLKVRARPARPDQRGQE